jgi:Glycosyl transferase family 2
VSIEFTVVISTCNRLSQLQQTLESVFKQTLPCEVIVIDDGSQDETRKYIRSLKQRVVYYRNPLPLGYEASINAGVELARGNWIKFLEPGDRLQSNCLQTFADAIAESPTSAIVAFSDLAGSDLASSDLAGSDCSIGCTLPKIQTKQMGQVFQIDRESIHYLMWLDQLDFGMPQHVAVRRDAFLRSGGWVAGASKYWEALETWTRVAEHGDALLLDRASCKKSLGYLAEGEAHSKSTLSLQERIYPGMAIKHEIYQRMSAKYRDLLSETPEYQSRLQLQRHLVNLTNEGWLPIEPPAAPLHPQHTALALKAWRAEWAQQKTRFSQSISLAHNGGLEWAYIQ